MKYVKEFRAADLMQGLRFALDKEVREPLTIMEVCGGQTHSILRYGIDRLLPDGLTLVHGPGCPVCVTPADIMDQAVALAKEPGVIFCSYGDMLRVPGRHGSLLQAKAAGADVRVIYTPMDLPGIVQQNPQKTIVFFAIGFETTAPAHARVLHWAQQNAIKNLSFLMAHVLVPPVLRFILSQPDCRIDGFLAAGHVCAITGYSEYHQLARDHDVPIVVTGFEPLDIMSGLLQCVSLRRNQEARVVNQYSRVVSEEGNRYAQALMDEVFVVEDVSWRGLGVIPASGLRLSSAYRRFDALERFGIKDFENTEDEVCQAGKVLLGQIKPPECPHFGKLCQPAHPLGAPMVSSEGACAAYHTLRAQQGDVNP